MISRYNLTKFYNEWDSLCTLQEEYKIILNRVKLLVIQNNCPQPLPISKFHQPQTHTKLLNKEHITAKLTFSCCCYCYVIITHSLLKSCSFLLITITSAPATFICRHIIVEYRIGEDIWAKLGNNSTVHKHATAAMRNNIKMKNTYRKFSTDAFFRRVFDTSTLLLLLLVLKLVLLLTGAWYAYYIGR